MDPLVRRATGAYYTPPDASSWMAQWLVGTGVSTVLEPSFGDGSFVDALSQAVAATGASLAIHAVEIDEHAFAALPPREGLEKINSDFHRVEVFPVDGVIGNPPFVRLRHLDDAAARAALDAATASIGSPVDPSGSTWMTFASHAANFLRPGGSLALVLPADALYVRYARPFWSFMAGRFGALRVVRCRERIFGDLLQDVVILLAERSGSATAVITSEVFDTLEQLISGRRPVQTVVAVDEIIAGGRPFVRSLLPRRSQGEFAEFVRLTVRADSYAKFNIGYVAGDKHYFHPPPGVQDQFALPARSLRPAVRSGRRLARTGLRTSSVNRDAVGRLWLPDPVRLTDGERRYVEHGEAAGIDQGYKTSRRQPWYLVPGVRVPDLLLPVFGELPKLMFNDARVVASNSLLAGYLHEPVDADALALCWYSSATRLGIELSVHSLGGGVLVLVPTEADGIRMPALPVTAAPGELVAALESSLRAGDVRAAYEVGDEFLARAGWGGALIRSVRQMADELLHWRVDR